MRDDNLNLKQLLLCTSFAALLGAASQPSYSRTSMIDRPPGAEAVANASSAQAENSLKNIKDVVHRLRIATLDLINDVEQRSMVVTGEPDIIEPIAYDDKKPVGWAREMVELGPALPPRKQWLDVDLSHLGELLKLLQSDFDSANMSVDKNSQAQGSWAQMNTILQDVQEHYKNLKELTKGPKYDNLKIGQEALGIYDDMSKMSHPWKQALKGARG